MREKTNWFKKISSRQIPDGQPSVDVPSSKLPNGVRPKKANSGLTPFGGGVLRYGILLGLCGLAGVAAFASTANWPFSAASEMELYDSARIEVKGGKLQLSAQKPWYRHDSKAEFDAGTYSDTEYLNTTNLPVGSSSIKATDSGLVAYYKFNGSTGSIANAATTGLTDATASANNGTASNSNGTGMAFAAGRFGNGVSFDGTDDAIGLGSPAGLNSALESGVDFTISTWFKTNGALTSKTIFQKYNGATPNAMWLRFTSGGALQLSLLGGNGQQSYVIAPNNNGNDSQWHHVAGVWISSTKTAILYLDGVLLGTGTPNASINALGSGNMYIGTANWGEYFNGSIDDLAIYNRALTKDEIELQAAAGAAVHMKPSASMTPHAPKLAPGMPGLIAYWPLDASTGSVATDLAGANKGTLVNMENGDWVTGVNGKALDFGGDTEYVSTNLLLNLGNFTFAAWVKPVSSGAYADVIDNYGSAGSAFIQLSKSDTNKAALGVRDGGLTFETGVSGTSNIADGNWHHIAGVRKLGAYIKIYVDGVEENSVNLASTNFINGLTRVGIGAPAEYSINYFNGSIDEAAIFNRALSAGEIAYLAGKKGETATFTGAVMDGEITSAAWNKMSANFLTGGAAPSFVAFTKTLAYASAIAVGDINNDGAVDVLIGADNTTSAISYSLNDGYGSLGNKVQVIGNTKDASQVQSVQLADIDLDGDQDIVAAFKTSGEVVWYANDGSGSFGSANTIKASGLTSGGFVQVGDVNGDGYPDVVAASYGASGSIFWWANDGAGGGWSETTAVASINNIGKIKLADLDNDGDLDILASSIGSSKISWAANNGSGSYGALSDIQTSYSLSYVAEGLDAADLDGDGYLDIIAGRSACGAGELVWWKNNQNATFGSKTTIESGIADACGRILVGVGDFNGDGSVDLIRMIGGSSSAKLWTNNGTGTFSATTFSTGGSAQFEVLPADFNADGNLDYVHPGHGSDIFAVGLSSPWKKNAISITGGCGVAGDLDGDGDIDLFCARGAGSDVITWVANNGSGAFGSENMIQSGFDDPGGAAFGDFDGDGDLDLVASAYAGGEIAWWANNGSGSFGTKTTLLSLSAPGPVALADLDGDGDLDLISSNGELAWWPNDGSGNLGTKQTIEASNFISSAIIAKDLDADGDLDIVSTTNGNDDIAFWLNTNGAGSFGTKTSLSGHGSRPTELAVADLDRDGDLDILSMNSSGLGNTTLDWWANNGAASFGSAINIEPASTTADSNGLAVADVDGDGYLDVLFCTNSSGKIFWRRNNGDATFGAKRIIAASYGVSLADLNGDGLLDVVSSDGDSQGRVNLQQSYAQIRFQARTDTVNPLGAGISYVGPDNTTASYFGNEGSGRGAGVVSNLDSKRYFQYKATFYRNDATLDPIIRNVKVDYTANTYSTLNPYATSASATPFTYLTSFTPTSETQPAGSGIKYQLSADGGMTWKYYNSGWVASNGTYSQSSTSSTINSNVSTFDDSLTANGSLKWKAVMNSNGTAQPSVDAIDVGYEVASIALVKPNASTDVWKVGTQKQIKWTPTGTIPDDLTLEYNTAGSTSIFDKSIATNVPAYATYAYDQESLSGSVAVWHFEGLSGNKISNGSTAWLTDSKGSYHGTASNANGSGLAFTSGKFGTGISLDGVDDYVDISHAGLNITGKKITLSAWVKITSNMDGALIVGARHTSSDSTWALMTRSAAGSLRFRVITDNGSFELAPPSALTLGTWYHVAGTYDGTAGMGIFYLDGVSVASSTAATGDFVYGSNSKQIGAWKDFNRYIGGEIDEVAIFNRALSPSEIKGLASSGAVWTVPDENSASVRVRARSVSAPAISDVSDANSAIYDIAITAPAADAIWTSGTQQNVTWTADSNVPNDIVIEYSYDGTNWTVVDDTLNTPLGSQTSPYAWNIPASLNGLAKIRVRSKNNSDIVSTSGWMSLTKGAAETRTWDNGSGDGNWSNPVNWTGNVLPAANNNIVFDGTSNTACTADIVPSSLTNINLNSGYTNTVTFSKNAANNGMTLTLAGNLTVNSGMIAFAGDTTTDSISGNDTYQGTAVNDGKGYTVNAVNVTVANGAKISVDGKGFTAKTGPGFNDGVIGYYGSIVRYGSATQPTSLGSGGYATSGGGALKLNVSGTTTVNGTLSANGATDGNYGPSGGSLWIITDVFAGASTGKIEGKGGDGYWSGGGGGRVAISWNSSTYAGTYSLAGGINYNSAANYPGTLSLPWGSITDFTVNNSLALVSGTYTFSGNLNVTNNATLLLQGDPSGDAIAGNDEIRGTPVTDGSGVIINAANLTIDSGSTMSADAQGFPKGQGPGYDSGTGAGSYGGNAYGSTTYRYGSLTQPLSLGSGGTNSGNWPPGGGAIKLSVSSTLTVNGTLSAKGPNACVGPSGGSLWIFADTISGSGTMDVSGGTGGCPGQSGGGGRFSIGSFNNFNFTGSILSEGGAGTYPAQPGTIAYLGLTSPNGSETWKNGRSHLITWLAGRDVPNDLTLEYSTGGASFTSPVSINTNVNATHHNEEKMSGAVGVWHFGTATSGSIANGATTGLTDSKGTNNGTASNANGTGMAFTSGKFGGAVSFDAADDYVWVSNAAIDNLHTFTWSAWFKATTVGSGVLLGKGGSSPVFKSIDFTYWSGDGQFDHLSGYVNTTTNSGVQAMDPGRTNDSNWHHVAMTFDNAGDRKLRLYKDGVLVSTSAAMTGTISAENGNPLHIGARPGFITPVFDGKIDEVAIFNRVLSADEVAALATSNPGYVWTVPNVDSSTVRVRATSASQPNLTDMSNANFTITDLNITAPNGAEIWKVGSASKNITWTAGSAVPNNLILEYTTQMGSDPSTTGSDPFSSWVAIDNTDSAPLNASPATHTWVSIPDSVSSTARVRVRSSTASDLVDVSNANFTIADLNLTFPNGGNLIYEGEKINITWSHGGTNLTDLVLEEGGCCGQADMTPPVNSLSVRQSDTSRSAGFNPASLSGAVGVWRMNEGSGTSIGDSASTHTGTLTIGAGGSQTTTTQAWVNGQFGKALNFDGTDDYVNLGSSLYSTSNGTQPYTSAAWIKNSSGDGPVIAQYDGGESTRSHFLALYGGYVAFYNASCFSNVSFLGKTAVNNNQWHHIASSRNSSGIIRLYVDGILDAVSTGTCAVVTAPTNTTIGVGYGFFSGSIDEAAIYNRVLTDAEIRKLAGGSYEWTVSDTPNTQKTIRVRSASATELTDINDADFEIRARSVTVNAPNGSESWQEGSRQTIQWTTAGLMSNNLTLEYCQTASCTSPVTIATGVDAGGKPFERAVGAWGFGAGTGQTVTDKSGMGNNGTLGATSSAGADDPRWVLGKLGHALEFDGVDDYVTNATVSLAAGSKHTLTAWIKASSIPSGWQHLVDLGVDRIAIRLSGNTLQGLAYDGSSYNVFSAGTINTGSWYHLAMTFDGTTQTIYVNGTSAGSNTIAGAPQTQTGIYIGGVSLGGGDNRYFNGIIDEVQVYNRVLTSAEITALSSGKANYPWIVADAESATARVKVTDANRTASNDLSDNNFAMTPRTVAVSTPNGTESWPYNTLQYITWNTTGPLSNNLTIKYDPDTSDGTAFPTTVATGVDAGGVPFSGAVGAWGFGAGSGTSLTDKSGNSNTGTLNLGTGGNTIVADAWKVGKFGYGIEFDGVDDSISVANNANIDIETYSVSFWVKTTKTGTFGLIRKGVYPADYPFNIYMNAGKVILGVFDGTFNPSSVSTTSVNDGNWHHVVAMRQDGVELKIYVDGVLEDTDTDTTADGTTNGQALEMGPVHGADYFGGFLDEVQIYNRALTPAEITQLASGKGVYPWTIPDPGFSAGTRHFDKSKIRVFDANRTATTDDSDANFDLRTPIISVTAPTLNEVVPFGTSKNITWTHNDTTQGSPVSTNLKIEYSKDGGSSYPGGSQIIIADDTANGGPVTSPFDWGVTSGAVSNTVKVRIRDNDTPYGEGESSQFKVTGSFSLTKPNGNEKWAVGFPHQIAWLVQGSIPNVTIYTHNGDGVPITTIQNSYDASQGAYDWTPNPADAGTGLYVRVQDASDAAVYDDSNATFTVSKVVVTNPSARLLADANWTINWTQVGVSNIKLEYSLLGDFSDATTIVNSVSTTGGSYNNSGALKVPMKTVTTFKIRATDVDAPGTGDQSLAIDASDSNTTIYGTLVVVQPNGGETIQSSQPYDIKWTTAPANVNIAPNILITFAKDGNFNNSSGGNIVTVAASAPNHNDPGAGNGKYTWYPDTATTLGKIRVADADDPNATNAQNRDDSNAFFTVEGIQITSPSGGETALVNGNFNITFSFTGSVTNTDFYYSPTGSTNACGGAGWTLIQGNVNVPTNPYTWQWTGVADDISDHARVCVRNTNDTAKYAISNPFNIKGTFSVTTPGALLKVGDAYTVQWSTTGSMPDQKVEFSKSGLFNGDEITIADLTGLSGAQTPTNQSVAWTDGTTGGVADQINNNAGKFRVTDVTSHANGSAAASGMSGTFSIGANFSLTAPLGSAVWGVNEGFRNITWNSTGTVGNVQLQYLAENDNYAATGSILASTPNDGSQAWNPIPDIVSLRGQDPQVDRDILVKVRICDADSGHPSACVDSSAFTVKWYTILWEVRDADSSALMDNLSVTEVDGSSNVTWSVSDYSLDTIVGLTKNYQYATYNTTWSKATYSSGTLNNWLANADKTNIIYLQNSTTAGVDQRSQIGYTYDNATKILTIKAWMEKAGKIQTQSNLLGDATVTLTDGTTTIATLTDTTPDSNGYYDFTFDNGGDDLVPGSIYTATSDIVFNGVSRATGHTITITADANIGTINTKLGTTSDTGSDNTLFGKVASVAAVVNTINTTTQSTNTKVNTIDGKVDTLQSDMNLVKTATGAGQAQTVYDKVSNLVTTIGSSSDNAAAATVFGKIKDVRDNLSSAGGSSFKLIPRQTTVKSGGSVVIQVQAPTGLTGGNEPAIWVYSPGEAVLINGALTTEMGTTGIYAYSLATQAGWGTGAFTVIAQQGSNMDSFTLNIQATDLETVGSNVASILSEVGTGNIAAIKTKTDTIDWNDVTGLVTSAGQIKAKTDTIDWTNVTGIKTKTDTINWADVTAIGTKADAIQAKTDTIDWSDISTIKIDVADIKPRVQEVQSDLNNLIKDMIVAETSVNDASATANSFVTALTNTTDDFYKDQVIVFTSGANAGQVRTISGYNGTTKTISLATALSAAPGNGDTFTILASVGGSTLAAGADADTTAAAVWNYSTRRLTDANLDSGSLTTLANLSAVETKVDAVKAKTDTITWTDVAGIKAKTDTIDWTDVTGIKAKTDTIDWTNITAIKTKTDTISWADVTGLITTAGDIKTQTDTIDWSDITAIKTKTNTINWADVTAIGTDVTAVKAKTDTIDWTNITAIKTKTDTIDWADVTGLVTTAGDIQAKTDTIDWTNIAAIKTKTDTINWVEVTGIKTKTDTIDWTDVTAIKIDVADMKPRVVEIQSDLNNLIKDLVVSETSVNDASATATSFVTPLTSATDDFYKDQLIVFTSGSNTGQVRRIANYNGTTKAITVATALAAAPGNGDTFTILANVAGETASGGTGGVDEGTIATAVWSYAGRHLASSTLDAGSLSTLSDVTSAKNAVLADVDQLAADLVVARTSVNDPSASNTAFVTQLTNAVDDFYKDQLIVFTAGANAGQVRRIAGYNGTTKALTLATPLAAAPSDGDAFTLLSNVSGATASGGTGGVDENSIATAVWGFATRRLSDSTLDSGSLATLADIGTVKAKTDTINWADVTGIKTKTDTIDWNDVTGLVTNSGAIKAKTDTIDWADVAGIKTKTDTIDWNDVTTIKTDVADIKPRVAEIQSDLNNLIKDMVVAETLVADPTALATTTSFPTGLTNAGDDFYKDQMIVFTSGPNAGQVRIIAGYDGTTKTISLGTPLAATPGNNDTFTILANVAGLTASGVDQNSIATAVWNFSTRELTSGTLDSGSLATLADLTPVANNVSAIKAKTDTIDWTNVTAIKTKTDTIDWNDVTGLVTSNGQIKAKTDTIDWNDVTGIKTATDTINWADVTAIGTATTAIKAKTDTIDWTHIAAIKTNTDTINWADVTGLVTTAGQVKAKTDTIDWTDVSAIKTKTDTIDWSDVTTIKTDTGDMKPRVLEVQGDLNGLVKDLIVADGAVNDNAATNTSFVSGLTSTTNDFYKDQLIVFTSGANAGQVRRVSGYDGTTKALTLGSALATAPANTDTFALLADVAGAAASVDPTSISTAVWNFANRNLTSAALDSGSLATLSDLTPIRNQTDTINWTDVTGIKSKTDTISWADVTTLVNEVGTGNISAIKTKTDTIDWNDVTGIVTASGAIQAKTDTIDWTNVAAIKTKTDTISWSDVTSIGTNVSAIKTATDTINWTDVTGIKAKTDTINWANVTAIKTKTDTIDWTNVTGIVTDTGAIKAVTDTINWNEVAGIKTQTDTINWADVTAIGTATTAIKAKTDTINWANINTLMTEIGTGSIAAIKTKTDTINWTDVTGVVTASGAIQAKTDTIDWTNVTAIKTNTDTINWTDVTGIKTKTDTIDWTDIDALAGLEGTIGGLDLNGITNLAQAIGDVKTKTDTLDWNDVAVILDQVKTKIPTKLDEINLGVANKGGRGQLLKRDTKFTIGQTASIRFQFDSGKSPTVDIYSPDNKLLTSGQVLKEISTTGVYSYDFKIPNTAAKGDYTVIASEPGSGFTDSMVLTVLQAGSSQEEIGASASSASTFAQNASTDAKKAFDEVLALKKTLGGVDGQGMGSKLDAMQSMMHEIQQNLVVLTGAAQKGGEEKPVTLNDVHDMVLDVMKELKAMASQKGVNLDAVYKSVESQGDKTQDIQNMVTAVEAATKATQEIIEKAQDKPVMTTWFES